MLDAEMTALRKRIANPAWADNAWHQPAPAGTALDGLESLADRENWTSARAETLAALQQIVPRQKLAVLCMACNEAPYLAEFIAHYFAIGAEHIFVYTNGNTDGTDEILRWFAHSAPVTVIPVQVAPGVNVQRKNYEHAVLLLPELRLYEWVLFVDVDEFLVPAAQHRHHLQTMLAAAPRETDVILFPWRWRLWDRGFERTPGCLAQRFPHAQRHDLVKPLVRMRKLESLRMVHIPWMQSGSMFRDTAFQEVPEGRFWTARDVKSDSGGWIEHFWGKSFEEFWEKRRRGLALGLREDLFRRSVECFFEWTQKPGPENYLPVPEAVIAQMRAVMQRFAGKAGYAEMIARIEAKYLEYANGVRGDAALRLKYDEMLRRFPWG